jgi:hypothetical protein
MDSNTIVFEDADKALTRELLTSSPDFTIEDVKSCANIGAVSINDAKTLMTSMESSPVKFNKAMKMDVMHKKALIVLAKDKNDPEYRKLVELHDEMHKVYDSLEEKYGREAALNQSTLIGKLLGKFRGNNSNQSMECASKISDFQ